MKRLILHIGVATFAFIVGIATNWSLNTLGRFVVDEVYSDPAVDVKIYNVIPDERSIVLPAHHCGQLIVSVTAEGALDLNRMPMGSLYDTSALSKALRTALEERMAWHARVDSLDLPLRAPKDREAEKTVYIKAPRSMSYGEIADLIATIKAAGADHIGLIADTRRYQNP